MKTTSRIARRLCIWVLGCFGLFTLANNVQVSNVSLTGQNAVSNYAFIQFDLNWENSWRTSSGPANWDAVWIFARFRVNGGNWQGANFSTTPGHHVPPAGAEVALPNNSYGVILQRDADGNGDIDWDQVQLRWNYGGTADDAIVDVKVFAIEMVYIPQGSFYVGSTTGGTEVNRFHTYPNASTPFQVTSENAITIGTTNGNLYYVGDNASGGDQTGTLQATFPKGFDAFYCMKYEISQQQWVDFFNTLTDTQKTNRDITGPDGKNSDAVISRNGVSWPDSGNATTTLPDVAMNYLSPEDLNAYFDWAGLRPMSELEYEKACRGPLFPVANAFAWGNSDIHSSLYTLTNDGLPNEGISDPGENIGNAAYSPTDPGGPMRCGIFAASSPNHTRAETGGSYYGVMELSGNLYERVVTVGTAAGRAFSGVMGNGIISATGNGTAINWPNNTTGDGYSYRGASWLNGEDFLRVADRFDGASVIGTGNNRLGGRGALSAQ